jgi:hypothetical protein
MFPPRRILDFVIEAEFVWMRTHPNGIRLVLFLLVNPEFDVVLGQELVIFAEFRERFVERSGGRPPILPG